MKLRWWEKIIVALVVLAVAAPIVAWMVFQWTECRDMGFSFWYCIQHVS